MGSSAGVSSAAWKAPKVDGEVLIWPGVAEVEAAVRRGGSVGAGGAWCGVALGEVRRRTRAFLGHVGDDPLIVTGHQTELHHPGLWVKNVVIDRLARRLGGTAMHLAVDTDQPKHLVLRYPADRTGRGGWVSLPLTDDAGERRARWSGWVSGPSPAHAAMLERRVTADLGGGRAGFEPMVGEFLASMRRHSLEEGVLPPMLVSALHELDWGLGLRYDAILASPLWLYEGFLLLVGEVLSDAGAYAAAYNKALARYRAAEGVRDAGRPMPDLGLTTETAELPFWLDDLSTGQRMRPVARRAKGRGGWGLQIGGEWVEVDGAGPGGQGWEVAERLVGVLRRTNHRIAPRAVTLTLFMRLAVADLFVHGIGGGRYDRVTDGVMREGFGVEPPAFAVATGTLYFPWAVGRERTCAGCVVGAAHRRRHALLGERKREFLERVKSAPRGSAERRAAFLEMHATLSEQMRVSADWAGWVERVEQAKAEAAADEVMFDRELFYALQPRERLEGLMRRVEGVLG